MSIPRQTGKGNPHGTLSALMAAAFAFAALSIAPLGDRAAFGQCQYEITHSIIQGPPCWPSGNPAPIIPSGMNSMGHVVGRVGDCLNPSIGYGFLWIEGVMSVFPLPQGVTEAWHYDINDDGVITGVHLFPGQGYTGFAYDPHTQTYHYLMPLHDGAVATTRSSANAVNNQGVIAGSRIIGEPGDSPMPSNAVIWRPFEKGASVEDLGLMAGANSWASDIPNTSSDTVGSSGTPAVGIGYRQLDGKVQPVTDFFDFSNSFCHGAGDFGFATGSGIPAGNSSSFAFIWINDGVTLLDPLPGFTNCGASDVNAFGQVVTRCTPGNVPGLSQHGVTMNLRDLIESDQAAMVNWPVAINNAGQILTRFTNARAALLTPKDVPFGDLNYDCRVDHHDLLIVFDQWGPVPRSQSATGVPSADLNGDGVVNVTDLLILFDYWNP